MDMKHERKRINCLKSGAAIASELIRAVSESAHVVST